MKTCSISGCFGVHEAKGYCNKHYLKLWQYGSPTAGKTIAKRGHGSATASHGYRVLNGRLEHVLVAERALGKRLPKGAVVHHIDGDRHNNLPANLVICQSEAYHILVHQRQAALANCGHADWVRCRFCHVWSPPNQLSGANGKKYWHPACRKTHRRKKEIRP